MMHPQTTGVPNPDPGHVWVTQLRQCGTGPNIGLGTTPNGKVTILGTRWLSPSSLPT